VLLEMGLVERDTVSVTEVEEVAHAEKETGESDDMGDGEGENMCKGDAEKRVEVVGDKVMNVEDVGLKDCAIEKEGMAVMEAV
jgi:hypothetical protein